MTTHLSQVQYFLLDMDGTFNLGEKIIPGSLEFIEVLRSQGKDFIFLTNNSSKHRKLYAEKIARLGLPIPEEKIFTSGEATAITLQNMYPGASLYIVGTDALQDEFRQHGYRVVEDDADVVVLGFDTTLTYHKLWKLCDYVRAGLPYIATHPDFNCPTETGYMPDIGAMMAFVKASTGRDADLIVGKPNRLIVDALAQKLGVPIEKMSMVGDRLYTDIALGSTSGITTCLVLSGETTRDEMVDSQFQADYVFDNLRAIGEWLVKSEQE